ncbi:MAG TPA: methyltransferase domain-containing protein [Gemmataceae bacterium]|nr:methyltransferase domain-containing protein [Gemmataceae bacterium]
MNADERPSAYHTSCNRHLLEVVPASALHILDVGCAEGRLGEALKRQDPTRTVFGIEREPSVAARAAGRLDRVFAIDVEAEIPPLEPGSLDCILYGDVLEHLVDPEAVLRRCRTLLAPGGIILCSVPNAQHHSVLAALARSDFQYTDAGLLDVGHLRFFTYSTIIKLLLDAGFAPAIVADVPIPASQARLKALIPFLTHLGLHPERTRRYLDAYQYIVRGDLLPYTDEANSGNSEAEQPLSFVVCASDEATLESNLLASPCLREPVGHEVLAIRGCPNAAAGLNRGLASATHDLVVCVHQDVYLPRGWPARFLAQYREAKRALGPIGVAGVYGVSLVDGAVQRAGRVVDRDRLLSEKPALPTEVDTLDELLLAVPKSTPFQFAPSLGFHLYGADICLAARQQGLKAVALDALCFHHSKSVGLPPAFRPSAEVFARKWAKQLPIATSCVLFDVQGRMRVI